MPLTPIFHPQEDWYQAMVTKNKGSLKATNRQEEWYEEIVDSISSGSGGGSSEPILVTISNNVASMTSTEIKTAISEGKIVYLRDGDLTMYEITTSPSGSPNAVVFTYNYLNSGSRVQINDDGSIVRGSLAAGTYSKPSGGIPETDLAQAVKNKLNKFVVALTPTALDYSGTMDKTVAEINEAYLSGQRIVFYISAVGMNVEFPLVDANKSDDYEYPSFDAVLWNVIDNVFMHVSTSFTDNGDKDTYAVYTFPMTYDSANGVSF